MCTVGQIGQFTIPFKFSCNNYANFIVEKSIIVPLSASLLLLICQISSIFNKHKCMNGCTWTVDELTLQSRAKFKDISCTRSNHILFRVKRIWFQYFISVSFKKNSRETDSSQRLFICMSNCIFSFIGEWIIMQIPKWHDSYWFTGFTIL